MGSTTVSSFNSTFSSASSFTHRSPSASVNSSLPDGVSNFGSSCNFSFFRRSIVLSNFGTTSSVCSGFNLSLILLTPSATFLPAAFGTSAARLPTSAVTVPPPDIDPPTDAPIVAASMIRSAISPSLNSFPAINSAPIPVASCPPSVIPSVKDAVPPLATVLATILDSINSAVFFNPILANTPGGIPLIIKPRPMFSSIAAIIPPPLDNALRSLVDSPSMSLRLAFISLVIMSGVIVPNEAIDLPIAGTDAPMFPARKDGISSPLS